MSTLLCLWEEELRQRRLAFVCKLFEVLALVAPVSKQQVRAGVNHKIATEFLRVVAQNNYIRCLDTVAHTRRTSDKCRKVADLPGGCVEHLIARRVQAINVPSLVPKGPIVV